MQLTCCVYRCKECRETFGRGGLLPLEPVTWEMKAERRRALLARHDERREALRQLRAQRKGGAA